MTDPDTFAALLNSSVDRELGGPRPVPTFQPPLTEPAGVVRWRGPVLAAAAVAAVSAGTVVAIHHDGASTVRPASGSEPTVFPSPSIVDPSPVDVTSYPEASAVPGISVRTLTAGQRSAHGGIYALLSAPYSPDINSGVDYPVTVQYVMTPDMAPAAVLVVSVSDATGSCPTNFQVHAGHAYLVHCTVRMSEGQKGKIGIRLRGAGDADGFTQTFTLKNP